MHLKQKLEELLLGYWFAQSRLKTLSLGNKLKYNVKKSHRINFLFAFTQI